jgi:hypothetical protein
MRQVVAPEQSFPGTLPVHRGSLPTFSTPLLYAPYFHALHHCIDPSFHLKCNPPLQVGHANGKLTVCTDTNLQLEHLKMVMNKGFHAL